MRCTRWSGGLNCKAKAMNKNPSRVFYLALICYIVPWKLSIWMEGNSAARSLASCSRKEDEFGSVILAAHCAPL